MILQDGILGIIIYILPFTLVSLIEGVYSTIPPPLKCILSVGNICILFRYTLLLLSYSVSVQFMTNE